MRFRLENIGRGKVTRDVEVKRPDQLLRQVSRHLASRGVEIDGDGRVLVGGFREVGRVVALDDISRAAFHRWCERSA